MEMGVTVRLPRHGGRSVELVVRWEGEHTSGDLRTALAARFTTPVEGLVVAGHRLPDDAVLGLPPLLDGVTLVVDEACRAPSATAPPTSALELVVVGGPDAGHSRALVPPGFDIGRRPASGLRLDDLALSRSHARVEVAPDGVRVADLGSTNGVLVDDGPIDRVAGVDAGSTVVIGSSTIRLRRTGGTRLPVAHPGDGTAVVTTSVAPVPVLPRRTVESPASPTPSEPARIPWLAAVVPLPVALVLALLLGPQLLAFALLGPVMVLGNAAGDRWSARRRRRRADAEHAGAVQEARDRHEAALAEERRDLVRAHADPHQVLCRVEHRLSGLWSASSAGVSLGLGQVASSTTWVADGEATTTPLAGVPVVVDLDDVRLLGVVGGPEHRRRLTDWLVGQLCAALSPDDLRLVGPIADDTEWRRVPHASGEPGRDTRTLRVVGAHEWSTAATAPAGGRRLAIVHADTAGDLPDACRARLLETADGRHVYIDPTGSHASLTADGVGAWWAERVARGLAPLRTRGATSGSPGGPVTTATLLGPDRLTVDGVVAHWAAVGTGSPAAVLGTTGAMTYRVDLSRDGPHVLVGGTTGSGKSEFLRTLVTGLALESPPERLALLLVDFKGGAAFGPCVGLPHVVGLVTDLDEHLVHRVVTSLRAELTRREEVLAEAGVSDIEALGSGPHVLPRLVVVVDELRALVDRHPEVVSELVRLAAQGRSLGIHLVLATQRPGGAVTPEVQANVDLRVAFRVRDRADSVDVLDAPDAALIPPGVPGSGYARGGDGALTPFRTALVAPPAGLHRRLEVLDPGRRGQPRPSAPSPDRMAQTAAVVAIVADAAARRTVPAPAPPWVPPLPRALPREATDAPPDAVALVDEPDRQRRSLLRWDWSALPWRVVGRPTSGRTSALRALVAAATSGRSPDELHVHVIDAAGGLHELRALPHLGTYCRADAVAGPPELVAYLAREVASRRAPAAEAGGHPPRVLLVVDGWEQLVEADDPRSPEPLSDAVLRVLRDGAGVGIGGLVAGGRGLLHSRWTTVGGETMLLGRVDPLDAVTVGVRERDLPVDPSPGRGVLVTSRREVQVLHVTRSDLGSGAGRPAAASQRRPWRHRPLPELVRRSELEEHPGSPAPATGVAPDDVGLLLGCGGPEAAPWSWSPPSTGGRLLVVGPPRSGRTSALRAIALSARAVGRAVALVHGRIEPPGGWRTGPGISDLGPDDVDALVALRRADPRLVLLVDDADRLDGAAVGPVITEIADLAAGDGGAVAVATTTSSLATRFRGPDVDLARHGCGVVLSPAPGDGEVLGVRTRRDAEPRPGRGVAVVRGRTTPVQVLWHEPRGGDDRA